SRPATHRELARHIRPRTGKRDQRGMGSRRLVLHRSGEPSPLQRLRRDEPRVRLAGTTRVRARGAPRERHGQAVFRGIVVQSLRTVGAAGTLHPGIAAHVVSRTSVQRDEMTRTLNTTAAHRLSATLLATALVALGCSTAQQRADSGIRWNDPAVVTSGAGGAAPILAASP